MANITITNNDLGSVELQDGKFRDELLVFAGADTFVPGTLLARQSVSLAAITATPDGGNTGDGTVTAVSVVAGKDIPIPGNYRLECIEAVTNLGVFKLLDPNGAVVADHLRMLASPSTFEVGGLIFTITDGAADFAAGDFFTLPVAADGKLVPFDPAGAGGAQLPIGVLTYKVERTAGGNEPIRALLSGEVNKTRLIIDADGDGSNITAAILDQLRSAGIHATDVDQLANFDNPQP